MLSRKTCDVKYKGDNEKREKCKSKRLTILLIASGITAFIFSWFGYPNYVFLLAAIACGIAAIVAWLEVVNVDNISKKAVKRICEKQKGEKPSK